MLPLHYAFNCYAYFNIIEKIFKAYPDAMTEHDYTAGDYPQHCSLWDDVSSHVIIAILKGNLNTIEAHHKEGSLPPHFSDFSRDVIKVTMVTYQNAAKA